MKLLGIICFIIIFIDVLSIPVQYVHDRSPRPAWKKNYARNFGILSFITDLVLFIFVVLTLRGIW